MDSLTINRSSGAPAGTALRPLLGLTVLLVEDSRFCSEAVRLMCLKSGARLRRADCLAAAYRHLATYRPSLALVDLGLPDGSGLDIIRKLAALRPDSPVVLATSGDDPALARPEAIKAGADGYLPKPIKNLRHFQTAILRCFPERERSPYEQVISLHGDIKPDVLAVAEDLGHLCGMLTVAVENGDQAGLRYCAQFLNSLAEAAGDITLKSLSDDLMTCQIPDKPKLDPIICKLDARVKGLRAMSAI